MNATQDQYDHAMSELANVTWTRRNVRANFMAGLTGYGDFDKLALAVREFGEADAALAAIEMRDARRLLAMRIVPDPEEGTMEHTIYGTEIGCYFTHFEPLPQDPLRFDWPAIPPPQMFEPFRLGVERERERFAAQMSRYASIRRRLVIGVLTGLLAGLVFLALVWSVL